MPDAYRMPPQRDQLDDRQIADLLTFVRASWGRAGTPVRIDDVSQLREHTGPASSQPIVLQMR
ncbi:hypothetical protein [Bradyrhizobium sp. UNPA324]|uniref:c-type cytochrome n=1 Tax=Bradyrhizobium sp. UNPA324 TaxID=1141174 RepID=UPI001171DB4A|nr:hypothetical protein [Bradyrhizobium sp. UNPA324]TQF32969.1 hypothetical protein UNPA324_27955 [Bradyrhizobium sp. UNPA324]